MRLHPLRTLLTIVGILLGTAISVGVGLMNESTLASFQEMVDGIAGKTDLSVTAFEKTGLEVSVLDQLTALPEVKAAAPTVRVNGFLSAHPEESVLVLGIDALADKDFRTLDQGGAGELDPLAFLNAPDSILVPKSLAARHGIQAGDKLPVTLLGSSVDFTVRALVDEKGAAKTYGGNVVIVDLFAAEERLGRGGRIDQIDLLAKPGVSKAQLATAVKAALGEGFAVERDERMRQAEQMVESLRQAVDLMSGMALFVGMFLIYNTFATSVAQRRREIGVMRALGTSRAQVIAVFLGEAVLVGLVGAALGCIAGSGMAQALVGRYAQTVDTLYFRVHTETVVLSWAVFGKSVLLGVGSALVAAAAPAWQAARIQPVEALSPTAARESSRRWFRVLFVLGLVVLALVVAFLQNINETSDASVGILAATLAFIAITLLTPWLVLALCAALHPLLKRTPGLSARLGGDNLIRNAGRTAITTTALTIGITLAVTMGGSFDSVARSFDEWIRSSLAIDLSVRGSAAMPGMNSPEIPLSVADELAGVPGVADVGSFRMTPVQTSVGTVQLISINIEPFTRHAFFTWTMGDAASGYAALRDGKHVVISENLAARRGLRLGDTLEMRVQNTVHKFTVAGAIIDYTSDLGTMILDRDTYLRIFNDPFADAFDLWVVPGADPVVVREAIRKALPHRRLFMQTNHEFRDEVNKAVAQVFGMTDLVQVLVLVIAVIGILNTMLVSILDRTRELGMLRAVGFTREQLGRLILWEAGLLGLLAGILGGASGSAFAMYVFPLVRRQLMGWSMAGVFPAESVALGFAVALVSAVLAGLYPARKASQLKILEALSYE